MFRRTGGNFVKEGETCGDWLAHYLEAQRRGDEEINIVTIQGTIGASAQVGHTEGMANSRSRKQAGVLTRFSM